MRSILKFLLVAIITITIPTIIMSIAYYAELNEIGLLISQMLIILIFVLIFTFLMRYQRKYEKDTVKMIEGTRDLSKLRQIRDDRRSYKSKASATSKILAIEYSDEELANLRKYASTPEDMEHYFAAMIDNAHKEEREKLRAKRDAYMKRHGKKIYVYPDFKENLRTAGKWMLFFFAFAIVYNIIPNFITNDVALATYIVLGMMVLAVVMIMTILWIVRAVTSYWNQDLV